MRIPVLRSAAILAISIMFPIQASADGSSLESVKPASPAQSYRSPEERREAGLATQMADWLKVSGLFEIEQEYTRSRFSQAVTTTDAPTTASIQIGLDITPAEWLEAEIIFAAEYGDRYLSTIDEAMVGVNFDDWGLTVGKLYLPFGKYFSHFATGPALEFGETRKNSVVLDYSYNDTIEVAGFIFESEIDKQGQGSEIDWGISVEISLENDVIQLGAGFLSDLAETNEPLLENDKTFLRRVSGWNAYFLAGFEQFEFTAEALVANRSFKELESVANKPSSYNVELAYFPSESLQLAARVSHNRKLADSPAWQLGASSTWRFNKNFSITLDYLYGSFNNQFSFNDAEEDQEYSHQLVSLLVVEF